MTTSHRDQVVYLDHAATTPMCAEAVAAMLPFLTDRYGNPSGTHGVAWAAQRALDDARERLASLLGAHPGEVVFTSGGTEADNLAVSGVAGSSGVAASSEVAARHGPVQRRGAPRRARVVPGGGRADHRSRPSRRRRPRRARRRAGRDRASRLGDARQQRDRRAPARSMPSLPSCASGSLGRRPHRRRAGVRLARRRRAHRRRQSREPERPQVRRAEGCRSARRAFRRLGAAAPAAVRRYGRCFAAARRSGSVERAPKTSPASWPWRLRRRRRSEPARRRAAASGSSRRGCSTASPGGSGRARGRAARRPHRRHLQSRRRGGRGGGALLVLDELGVCASAGSACASGALEPSHVLLAMGHDRPRRPSATSGSRSVTTTDRRDVEAGRSSRFGRPSRGVRD